MSQLCLYVSAAVVAYLKVVRVECGCKIGVEDKVVGARRESLVCLLKVDKIR